MHYRRLGRTDLMVSMLGFGGVTINRIPFADAISVLRHAFELGINFVDTAQSYGESEAMIGQALRQFSGEIHLASKSRAQSASAMTKAIDESLKRLQTDHIAVYQFHDLREDDLDPIQAPGGALEGMVKAKEAGKIGHIGFSGHRPQAIIPAIETNRFDVVQVPFNIIDAPLFKDSLPVANRYDLGIIVMKPLCGGLLKSPAQALRYVLSQLVTTAIPGMDSIEQVEENVTISNEDITLSDEDLVDLEEEVDALGNKFCRRCGYCSPCPGGLELLDIFRYDRYHTSYFAKDWACEQYAALDFDFTHCTDCGFCEERCPYQLPVRDMLKEAHHRLGHPPD